MHFSRINTFHQWSSLKAWEQHCIAQLFMACGGFEEWSSFEEWSADVSWTTLLDDGYAAAHWFQFSDSGLLFDARSSKKPPYDLIIGSAVQHGFVCKDLELWKAIATAQNAPKGIDWKVNAKAAGRVMEPEGSAEENYRAILNHLAGTPSDGGDPTRRYELGPVKVWVDAGWEAGTITDITYAVSTSKTKQRLQVTAARLSPVEEAPPTKKAAPKSKKPQSRMK